MNRVWVVIAVGLWVQSCHSEVMQPLFLYRGDIESEKIGEVETLMTEIARTNGFNLTEKSREEMKYLTAGQEAFYIALSYEDDFVLTIANVGVGSKISLSIYDYGNLSVEDLEQLKNDVIFGLSDKIGIILEPVTP